MLAGNISLFTIVLYFQFISFFPIVRLLGNTNGRPYLSVVTSKRHHATTVLNVNTGPTGGWVGCCRGWGAVPCRDGGQTSISPTVVCIVFTYGGKVW